VHLPIEIYIFWQNHSPDDFRKESFDLIRHCS